MLLRLKVLCPPEFEASGRLRRARDTSLAQYGQSVEGCPECKRGFRGTFLPVDTGYLLQEKFGIPGALRAVRMGALRLQIECKYSRLFMGKAEVCLRDCVHRLHRVFAASSFPHDFEHL